MAHLPINHHLRPVYRTLAGLTGVWLLVFGVTGWSATDGTGWFAQGDWTALGIPTNRAFAVSSVIAGVVVLAATLVGRNVDRVVNLWGGVLFILAGTVMMPLSHTSLNAFNSSVLTSIASYVIGLVLVAAGLYGKVGTSAAAEAEEAARRGT